MKYLGVLVGFVGLHYSDWDYIETKYIKKCDACLANSASMGGRTILLNSNVSSISFYHMSLFLMNKTFVGKLDKHKRNFFWRRKGGIKRY